MSLGFQNLVLLQLTLLTANLFAQTTLFPRDKKAQLSGRVLAGIESPAHGAGVGPIYERFIFGVESKDASGKPIVRPVEILRAFHRSMHGFLPDSFFDYSKRYELKVERHSGCDELLGKLAYEKNATATGEELPPTNSLYIPYGVPRDTLKMDMLLPCYILFGNRYKVISRDASVPKKP